jgi:hypothetical protein
VEIGLLEVGDLPGTTSSALALFTFDSLADYEVYRSRFGVDPEFVEADRIRDESGCVLRYDRTFMQSMLPTSLDEEGSVSG